KLYGKNSSFLGSFRKKNGVFFSFLSKKGRFHPNKEVFFFFLKKGQKFRRFCLVEIISASTCFSLFFFHVSGAIILHGHIFLIDKNEHSIYFFGIMICLIGI